MIRTILGTIVVFLFVLFLSVCIFGWTTVKAVGGEMEEALNSVKSDELLEREIRDLMGAYAEAEIEAEAKAEAVKEQQERLQEEVEQLEEQLATLEGFLRDSRTRLQQEGRESFVINGYTVSRDELGDHVIRKAAVYKSDKELLAVKREQVQKLREALSSARDARDSAARDLEAQRGEHQVLLARLDAARQRHDIEGAIGGFTEPYSAPRRELDKRMQALRQQVLRAEARVKAGKSRSGGVDLPVWASPRDEDDPLAAIASVLEEAEVDE